MEPICYLYLILIILLILTIISYLRFAHQNKKMKEIFESMDIYLTKRWNSIPMILEFLKNDKRRDEEAYVSIEEILKIDYKNLSDEEKVQFNNELEMHLDNLINKTFKNSEANDNALFLDIRTEHIETEKNLDNIEKYYNSIVKKYNNRVDRFPSRLVALIFSFKEKLLFNPSILNEDYEEEIKEEKNKSNE